jgi:hypothetical protein
MIETVSKINYAFLEHMDADQLKKFIKHQKDNVRRNWLPGMHRVWESGIEKAEARLNSFSK